MPFTLSQLKSQDLRDIDHFYVQNNIGKVNNAKAQVFEERSTLLPEKEEDTPAHYKHRKKKKMHEAYLYTNIEEPSLDKTFVLNDANDVRIKNAERVCSYTAFSSGMKESNDTFKTSTQVNAYEAFSFGVEENNDIFKTSTQVSAQNIELKIKKKHKKNKHKENELENLYENFYTKKEKNKTKLKAVKDVKLQDSNECVFQDSESSCATEGSSKRKKKRQQKLLENGCALNNSFLENDRVSVSSIDSISTTAKTKKKRKEKENILISLNTTDVSKPKKRKLQTISEDDSEKNNLHFMTGLENSGALMENTEKLNDFVMPKKLKLEEDNTFSTDSDLLDSYLYFSYKNKQSKKKRKERIESFPMPIVIKTENDLDEEEERSFKNPTQDTPVHSDQSIGSTSKKHKKKHKDYLVEKNKNDSHDEAKHIKKKHKRKHKQVLEDELKSNDTDSEQRTNSNNEIHENTNKTKLKMKKDEDEERHVNELKNSTLIHSVKNKHSSKRHNKDVTTNMAQENDESYLAFKNVFLDTEVPLQTCDANDEVINLESGRKSKKHKKKSKDREIYLKYPEVTSVDKEKSIAEEEQENVGDKGGKFENECSEQEFKRKRKKSKVKGEDRREMQSDTILEMEMDESSSSDGPDDKFYIKKKNGRTEICNFEGGGQIQTGLLNTEDITGTCADRFEIKAVIKRRSDLYELHENNDVRSNSLNRKVCDDVVNAFKEKLTTMLNQCSKQICSESTEALEINTHEKNKTLLSLRVNLTFTQTRNNDQVDCHKNEGLHECEELKVASLNNIVTHDNEVQNCVQVNSNKNKILFECNESKIVSLSTIITRDDVQECTTVNCCKSKEFPEYEESKVTLPTNTTTQFHCITTDDCINKSAEIKMSADCKDKPETALEFCTSSEVPEKLTEDLIVCEDINFNSSSTQQSTPFNKNVKIIQNVILTESEALTHLHANNNNMEMINLKETELPVFCEIESQLESITEEDIALIAEELNYINANNHIQADKNSNEEVDGIFKNAEIQATNSEHCSDVSNMSLNRGTKKPTIFDEDTVILSPNKNKSLVHRGNEETDATSKENDNQTLESTTTKKLEECKSLNFKSFFNDSAETNTRKERNKEAECQKHLVFNNEPEHLNTENITENSSAVNNESKASSNRNDKNEIREIQDDSSFKKDLNISFEDLDSSFFLSDSDCDTQNEQVRKSSSKHISPNVTDLYNRLMCDISVDGDDTTTVDDIIDEALDNALETSVHLVEEYQFLKDLVICIPWEIPLAHTIETRMSSQPLPSQKQKFKELNVPLKLGPYTKEEDKIILSNFEEFCKVHDIPNDPKPFLNFKHGRKTLLNIKQRINYVQYLGKGLECRMLHSIYRRFICLYTEMKKGRFTEEEDTIIQKYINNRRNKCDNNKFSSLSKILNRHRLAVEKRYKYLLSKQKFRKDDYKIKDHIPEYLKHLMEILEVNEVNQLKDMKITRVVWLKLADKIGQNEIKVKRLWETIIYPRLFAKNPIDRDRLMKHLISKLIKLKKTDYRDVNWCEMAKEFDNVTPAYLYQVFRGLIGNYVPEKKRHNLSSTLKHLARAYRECDCLMKTQSKIEFENGQVSFIKDP